MSEGPAAARLTPELVAELRERQRRISRRRRRIAIIGMACRFPGGGGVEGFWERLAVGFDAVTRGRPGSPPPDQAQTHWGAYLERLDRFDAEFFRIAPVEADRLDPQQRMVLETSWEAIEDAGINPAGLAGSRTGVYLGISHSDYGALLNDGKPTLYTATGTSFATASGRVAFSLGLTGPAISVDTACSSSLVAMHLAAAGLQRGDADVALAGGVNAILNDVGSEALTAGGMLAPDGRCKTFSAAADGYVRGEGCGIVLMKRLADAERDGDPILAVLVGSALNQDGASAGLTVPNGPAQERVIAEALAATGLEPGDVDYLEAHGTGTELGDPIEIGAAAAVYGKGRDPDRPLLVGSVKTNVGHLECAAGVAGVLKVVLSMRAGVLPKHLHFDEPSPRIAWERLPVRITQESVPWSRRPGQPLRAGVSSFSFSGTNAHAVFEEYLPEREAESAATVGEAAADTGKRPAETARPHLLPLSGMGPGVAPALARRYLAWLSREPEPPDPTRLADVAWTASVGRSHFGHRAAVVFRDATTLRAGLSEVGEAAPPDPRASGKVAFLFTGQGSQWAGMGRALYEQEPAARAVLDACERAFREEGEGSLLDVMFGGERATGDLNATEWTQPALYALECALVAAWSGVGMTPDVVMGHSVGELAAAQAAGAFPLEAGLRFAARRGRLMGSLPRDGERAGGMLAVFAPAKRVRAALDEAASATGGVRLDIAAKNGAHQVVSGPLPVLRRFEAALRESGVRSERLVTSHAFHSTLVEPILGDLEEAASALGAKTPRVPLVSNLTGRVAAAGEIEDGAYWRHHARSPVAFDAGVGTLASLGVTVVVEIGPRAVLGAMAALCWPAAGGAEAAPILLASQRSAEGGEDPGFTRAVAEAYEAGLELRFEGLFAGEKRRRVSLPTYPFQRERYWVEASRVRPAGGHALLGLRRDARDGEVSFETELSGSTPGWLSDHRVFGEVVAPGALYASQVLEALRERGSGSPWTLAEVEIHRPLVLPDGAFRTVQVVLGTEGGFEVVSREEAGSVWDLHAEGRVAAGAAGGLESLDVEGVRGGLEAVDPAAIYRGLAKAGVAFGPSFRGLSGLWSGAEEALGEVVLPAELSGGGLLAHPALLDACFQVMSGLSALPEEKGVRLPVGWERLWLAGPLPERVFCRARLREGSGEIWKVDVGIYGPAGEALGGVEGFRLRRASRSSLLGVRVDELLYEVEWRAGPSVGLRSAAFLRSPGEVSSGLRPAAEFLAAEGVDGEELARLDAELERLSRGYALRALSELGWERAPLERFEGEALRRRLKVTGDHRKLFGRLLSLLSDGGVLARDPAGGWLVTAGSGEALPESLEVPEGGADSSVEEGLLRRCGESLSEVLRGRRDPLELLFGEEPGAADLYWKSPGARAVNRLVGEAVGAAVAGLPVDRHLSVVEVGAGTGATTGSVLPALPAGRTDYEYTDISAGVFGEAERRFGDSGVSLRYRALDIERDPGGAGLRANTGRTWCWRRTCCMRRGTSRSRSGTAGSCWRRRVCWFWWKRRRPAAVAGPDVRPVAGLVAFCRTGIGRSMRLRNRRYGSGRSWTRGSGRFRSLGEGLGQAVIVARGPAAVEREAGLFVLSGDGALGDDGLGGVDAPGAAGGDRGPAGGDREDWRRFFGSLSDEVPLRGVADLSGVRARRRGVDDG